MSSLAFCLKVWSSPAHRSSPTREILIEEHRKLASRLHAPCLAWDLHDAVCVPNSHTSLKNDSWSRATFSRKLALSWSRCSSRRELRTPGILASSCSPVLRWLPERANLAFSRLVISFAFWHSRSLQHSWYLSTLENSGEILLRNVTAWNKSTSTIRKILLYSICVDRELSNSRLSNRDINV